MKAHYRELVFTATQSSTWSLTLNKKNLVLQLLKMLPEDGNHQFSDVKNNDGNAILHEVATSNTTISVAEELLRRDARRNTNGLGIMGLGHKAKN